MDSKEVLIELASIVGVSPIVLGFIVNPAVGVVVGLVIGIIATLNKFLFWSYEGCQDDII